MQVQALYFGVLKDLLGCDREMLELGEGASIADALRLLNDRASKSQASVWHSIATALNCEYVPANTVLRDGDELALLPPVSGG